MNWKHLDKHNRTRASRGLASVLALAVLVNGSTAALAQTGDIAGVWIDHSGKGAVELAPCSAAPSRLCGHLVWLREPAGRNGTPLVDANNPDPALRGKAMCGAQIVGNLGAVGSGAWDGGWIYNPEDGGRFDVEVKRRSPDQIAIHGYAGIKFLGETFVWKRAPADLPRCRRD